MQRGLKREDGAPRGGHRVQLDAIRAIAVILVMIQHFDPGSTEWLELGSVGVRVFFVISGFLITGILLRARDEAQRNGESRGRVLRNFYARRFLRIFPAYYLVILATWLLGVKQMRQSVEWHLSYLSNVYFFRLGTGNYYVTHLWSLAVEEQFYLVWPLLMLFLPRRFLVPTIVTAILIGPLFRLMIILGGGNGWQASVLTPACLDTLGIGALMAALRMGGGQQFRRRLPAILGVAGLVIFLADAVGGHFSHSALWAVPFGFSIALWGAWVVVRAYEGFGGMAGRILRFGPLVYLGVISYGIYLIHNFVPWMVNHALGFSAQHEMPMPYRPMVMFAVSVGLASASWFLVERPINSLKRFFPY
jgi:peptidoglycan/LPS O-acetylase OafA/YrhL